MAKRRKDPTKDPKNKSRDTRKEMIQFVRQGDLDKETTESLIKEIQEICDFEDSLEEF